MQETKVADARTTAVLLKRTGLASLAVLALLALTLPVRAHDYHEGTVGPYGQPYVTCYTTGTGSGRIELRPNAVGLASGPTAVRYYIYIWQNHTWAYAYTTDYDIRDHGSSYEPVVITTASGSFTVVAEYWWHDGRAWSGKAQTSVTSFTQAEDYSRNPVNRAPRAPFQSTTCEAG